MAGPLTLTFTSATAGPQTVNVSVVDDAVVQGSAIVSIHHVVHSSAVIEGVTNFEGLNVVDQLVSVQDNDVAGVFVQESNGGTRLIEAPNALLTGAPFSDTYTVRLTSGPGSNVIVHVQPAITPTGGSINDVFTGDGTTTVFTLRQPSVLVARVTVDGVQQSGFTLDADGVTLHLATAPRNGGTVVVTYKIQNLAKQVLVSSDGINFLRRHRLRRSPRQLGDRADGVRPRDRPPDHRWRRHQGLRRRTLDRADPRPALHRGRRRLIWRHVGASRHRCSTRLAMRRIRNEFVLPFNPNLARRRDGAG